MERLGKFRSNQEIVERRVNVCALALKPLKKQSRDSRKWVTAYGADSTVLDEAIKR